MDQFTVQDCTLLTRMSGLPSALNLRELRDRLAVCNPNVLYHHFYETAHLPYFDNPDYRNDFAIWVKLYLGDRILSERLGIIDPYEFKSVEDLRSLVVELIDERMSDMSIVLSVPQGSEFFFMEASTIVFDTGERIKIPRDLPDAISRMSSGSIYYHFLEARRRQPQNVDDFSAWLMQDEGRYSRHIKTLAGVDFFFLSLKDLQRELIRVLSVLKEAA
jgi:hypothetical protein